MFGIKLFSRRTLFVPTLLAATVGPYVLMNEGEDSPSLIERVKSWQAARQSDDFSDDDFYVSGGVPISFQGDSPGEPVATPTTLGALTPNTTAAASHHFRSSEVNELHEFLRFDVSPRWVTNRWPRVSTITSATELQGLRVPLVTGTEINDLAGALTYYFDKNQRVQRITFQGTTGDERRLVGMVCTHFHLKSEPSLGAGLYLTRWNGQPTNAMRIEHAPVVRAASPHTRFQVTLELNWPNSPFGLSPEFEQTLALRRR